MLIVGKDHASFCNMRNIISIYIQTHHGSERASVNAKTVAFTELELCEYDTKQDAEKAVANILDSYLMGYNICYL